MSVAAEVDEALLRTMPLPRHGDDEDKDARGRVLVIGGSVEVPGGALLAGIGALRAGAGKLQIATCRSVAPGMALAVPEARVIGLDESAEGEIAPAGADRVADLARPCDAVLLGPGMMDGAGAGLLAARLLTRAEGACFVLDAAALHRLHDGRDALARGAAAGRVVLTPHAGEMARLLGVPRDAVLADRLGAARQAAAELQAVVAMKGSATFIVTPQGQAWSCDRGNVGLATSGSGDTLAGILAGLLARGAAPLHAAAWAVFLHAEAGARLARSRGPVGFLARELLAEIPAIMAGLAR
ncbi:NAD(P)H-hydrate dehydratase [Falsiroseomonas sp. CW058]|uniref:NAD(P)H-hydrate dehydratase n=1 Tax=Falsiroseomonas sp. CW058 TaxID=3388664 RepID=UPI003D324342